MRRAIDLLSAGELLVDFITAEFAQNLEEGSLFKRVPGGSPANLCMNMARLGGNTMLAASVGNDDMGSVLRNYVARLGVDVSNVVQVDEPTTLILVTRSAAVSNFQPYRGADAMQERQRQEADRAQAAVEQRDGPGESCGRGRGGSGGDATAGHRIES